MTSGAGEFWVTILRAVSLRDFADRAESVTARWRNHAAKIGGGDEGADNIAQRPNVRQLSLRVVG